MVTRAVGTLGAAVGISASDLPNAGKSQSGGKSDNKNEVQPSEEKGFARTFFLLHATQAAAARSRGGLSPAVVALGVGSGAGTGERAGSGPARSRSLIEGNVASSRRIHRWETE